MTKKKSFYFYLRWFCRLLSCGILLQTLFFKFSDAPESIYIFSKIGFEPIGRYVIGTIELIASVLILIPIYSWLGSFLAATIMVGAVFSHLTLLGVDVQGDQGLLFVLSLVVFSSSLVNLYLEKARIPFVGHLLSIQLENNDL
jgi:putative oxidoreductase